jgi:hypothetical protein
MSPTKLTRTDVSVIQCPNREADTVFADKYWMPRVRRSRKLSYAIQYREDTVAWVQCADPFGTRLAKPLQAFDIDDALELARGYFIDEAPQNIESCAIAMVLRRIPNDWYSKFGVIKKIVIVYQDLDAAQAGTVYKALGFAPYALCVRARHHTNPTRGNTRGHKIVWARHLRRVNAGRYDVHLPEPPVALAQGIPTLPLLVLAADTQRR